MSSVPEARNGLTPTQTELSLDGTWTVVCTECGSELTLGYGGMLPAHTPLRPNGVTATLPP